MISGAKMVSYSSSNRIEKRIKCNKNRLGNRTEETKEYNLRHGTMHDDPNATFIEIFNLTSNQSKAIRPSQGNQAPPWQVDCAARLKTPAGRLSVRLFRTARHRRPPAIADRHANREKRWWYVRQGLSQGEEQLNICVVFLLYF